MKNKMADNGGWSLTMFLVFLFILFSICANYCTLSRADHGQLHGTGDVNAENDKNTGEETELPLRCSFALSAHFRVWVRVWVKVAPHPDPQIKSLKSKEKVLFSLENRTFWSCWADSNRRPHPYQLQKSCCGLSLVIVPFRPHPFIPNGCGIFLVVSCRFLL